MKLNPKTIVALAGNSIWKSCILHWASTRLVHVLVLCCALLQAARAVTRSKCWCSWCWRWGSCSVPTLPFTCGPLRGGCMEARAVTAGLPAVPAIAAAEGGSEAVVGPWLSVSFTYEATSRGVGSRAQGVDPMRFGGFGFVVEWSHLRTIYSNPSRTRGSNQFAACSWAWRLKVWRKDPGVPGRSLVCCWCCGGPASRRLGLAHEQLGNVE